jgi:hypothetical protein
MKSFSRTTTQYNYEDSYDHSSRHLGRIQEAIGQNNPYAPEMPHNASVLSENPCGHNSIFNITQSNYWPNQLYNQIPPTSAINNISGSSDLSTNSTSSILTSTSFSSDDEKLALIIGIGDYPGNSSDLSGVDYDITDVENFLTTDSVWAGTAIDLLQDSNATKGNIVSELNTLCTEVTTGDDVLIYYSGHGCADGDLFCADQTEYSVSDLYSAITAIGEKAGNTGHVTVILDSCYSGSLVDYFNSANASQDEYTILTACSSSQASYDTASNGLFTSYLFDNALASQAADYNSNGQITVQEAYNYLTSSDYSKYCSVQLYGSGNYVIG